MDGSDTSSQLVVVALPSENDHVRKSSSEKEPHLTLLYLGENKFDPNQLALVTEYIEHASSLFSPFMLDVEKRGELGDSQADVLFFDKKLSRGIATFRDQLLKNDLIYGAYHSVDQFPEWMPHLTLGYPGTPAKKDAQDYARLSYVGFDRIALWTGEFSGPTFQLKFNEPELEVAMSQVELGRSTVGDILEHHGIKGMKWGVRRKSSSESKPPPSDDAKQVADYKARVKSGGTKSLQTKELQDLVNRMNLEQQYSKLAGQKSKLDKGLSTTKKILAVGKTVQEVHSFARSPLTTALKEAFKR